MKEPALYICPYCRTGFSDRAKGWKEACAHIKEKHHSVGPPDWMVSSERVPSDNLFELNTSTQLALLT